MDWKQGLRRGMLGGVPIHTRDRSYQTGRAIHVHEYPKRDTPFPEDMGKDTIKIALDAYVIGDDYMAQRNRLIAVCERNGPMSYTDHWGRSLRVVVESCDLKETSEEGRLARFSIKLIEAGSGAGGLAPTAIAATAAQLSGAAGALTSLAKTAYAKASVVLQR